MKDKVDI